MSRLPKHRSSIGLDCGSTFHLQMSIVSRNSPKSRKQFQRQLQKLQGPYQLDPLSEVLADRYRAPRQPWLRRKGD